MIYWLVESLKVEPMDMACCVVICAFCRKGQCPLFLFKSQLFYPRISLCH